MNTWVLRGFLFAHLVIFKTRKWKCRIAEIMVMADTAAAE
jgi:hypothetical protein